MLKKLLLFLGIVCFLGTPAFAENFYIKDYNVQMKVNKDKSLDIVETIDTYFTRSSHGIYRTIPLNGNQISNISASERNSISYIGNSVSLKLGDPDRYVSGNKSYRIAYTYTISDNKKDEFYFNIIGTDWDVPIHRASFNVTMPEEFDPAKVGLSIGKYGTRGFSGNAEFYVNGNNIVGRTTQSLSPREGITIRIELPQDYFTKPVPYKKYFFTGLILLLTGLSYLLWFSVGKDNPVVPVVTFYPPKDINSMEAEAILREGVATTKGITSLIVYLAHKGYLKIIDNYGSSFTLEKIKEYDGYDTIEREFLDALFKHSTYVNSESLLTSETFFKKCEELKIQTLELTHKQLYDKASVSTSNFIISLFLLISVIGLSIYVVMNFDLSFLSATGLLLLFPVIAIIVLCIAKTKSPFLFIWAIGFGGIPLLEEGGSLLNHMTNLTLQDGLLYLACIIICGVCLKNLPKRNRNGERVLGELKGLKKFIEVTEKHRLKELVNENPEYFYNVLPFAYIFGISDVWIKKFESIMAFSPDWYYGQHFSADTFKNLTGSIDKISVPSTSNGGISTSSSGGGGFSGGGHGGGGGGSW